MFTSRTTNEQCAALPLRETEAGRELLLITSRETRRWVLPKGWAEKHLTGAELAAKEAFEEAGLIGRMGESVIGTYHYAKRLGDGTERRCEVAVFRMTVEQELEDWPERHQRRRRWVGIAEAAELVQEAELAHLLRRMA